MEKSRLLFIEIPCALGTGFVSSLGLGSCPRVNTRLLKKLKRIWWLPLASIGLAVLLQIPPVLVEYLPRKTREGNRILIEKKAIPLVRGEEQYFKGEDNKELITICDNKGRREFYINNQGKFRNVVYTDSLGRTLSINRSFLDYCSDFEKKLFEECEDEAKEKLKEFRELKDN